MASNVVRHGVEQNVIHAIRRDGLERVFAYREGHPLSWTPGGQGF
jgi:hypothetical protein